MESPSPRYIITRAICLIALLVAGLMGFSFIKKKQRQSAISEQLQSITSDSSFFQQFYEEDARKTLARAIGLLAEANFLGVNTDKAISSGMGIKTAFFAAPPDPEETPVRERIIRNCLRANYENFLKLGFKPDFQTITALKNGELPPIPSGPQSGRKPEIHTLISKQISPGMEKVIANLELRPPNPDERPPSAIEIATAKQLAKDLASAGIIENDVSLHILEALTAPAEPK